MDYPPPATSILQHLTYPNPTVAHIRSSQSPTRNDDYYFPRQIKQWEGFDYTVLERIYDGSLLREAREGRPLPPYPTIHEDTDCQISCEPGARELFAKWNRTIVMNALRPLQDQFHPAIWRPGDKDDKKEGARLSPVPRPPPTRHQPSRLASSGRISAQKKKSLHRMRPDSGSRASSVSAGDGAVTSSSSERFIKEYKTTWDGVQSLFDKDLFDVDGEIQTGKENKKQLWPLRQAYTYCIRSMCRYGCILTCKEAFIFRVRPRNPSPSDGYNSWEALRSSLIHNGMVEYISVPWTNHWKGDVEDNRSWTVNLALWFVHVLAGSHFEAAWEYNPLVNETIIRLDMGSSKEETMQAAGPSADETPELAIDETPEASTDEALEPSTDETPESATSTTRQILNQVEGEDGSSTSDDSEATVPWQSSPVEAKRKRLTNEDEEEDQDQDQPVHSFSKRRSVF